MRILLLILILLLTGCRHVDAVRDLDSDARDTKRHVDGAERQYDRVDNYGN